MKFAIISKIVLIFIFPIVLFLLVLNFASFDESFYKEKFSEYGIQKIIPNAILLHEEVTNFITGKNIELPNEFNEREKQHLLDVRKLVKIFKIALYLSITIFLLLFIISLKILKSKKKITNFIGNVFLFGSLLTIFLSGILFFLINSNFQDTFESFHRLFFEKGTYVFNPANEIIVRLYPEQLFMDLGIRILKIVILASLIAIFVGIFLICKSKNKKNKKNR